MLFPACLWKALSSCIAVTLSATKHQPVFALKILKMPGLRNQGDNSMLSSQHQPLLSTSISSSTMAKPIKFIPPQIDPLASTSTEAARKNPLRLLLQDLGVLIKMMRYLPWTIIPFRTSNKGAELYISPTNMLDIVLNSWLVVFQSILLLIAIPAFIILPGGVFLLSAALCIVVILVTAWPMQGQRIAYSRMDERTAAIAKRHGSERWVFVNGIMTGWEAFKNAN
jgi:hypothetical protein